jgi:hypothetical protein
MFQWDKSVGTINIPAGKVVQLFRSMREVQLALPGVSAQEASAFLCQYQVKEGVGTVVIFHLHKSRLLAFYYSDPRVVSRQKTDSMLDQGLNFVESMGFLMTDQDIPLLEDADQERLWASLPLKDGLPVEVDVQSVAAPIRKLKEKPEVKVEASKVGAVTVKKKVTPAKKPGSKAVKDEIPVVELEKVVSQAEPEAAPAENVDDLLAAVEAMRAKRPGLRARRSPPSAEEMDCRRLQLREIIGRILASL